NISRAKLSRDMRFKSIAIISLLTLIVSSTSSIYLATLDLGVWSLIYGGLIGSSLSAMLFMIHSRTLPYFAYNKRLAKQLGGYGVKLSINDIIEYLRRETPNFMIGKMLDSTMVGLFNKGVSTSAIPLQTIAGSAYQTVFRALSSTQDNIDKSKYIYLRTITLVCVYTLPFYIGLIWLAEPFITTLYGEKWRLAAAPLQIFCIVRMLGCFGNPSGAVMAAQNMLGIEIKLQLVTLVITIIGCWYGIQQNNIASVALYLTPSIFFIYLSVAIFACKRLQVSSIEFFKSIFPGLLLSTCLALALSVFELLIKYYNIKQTPLAYILSASGIGSFTYSLLFLFLPISSLKTEQNRWKSRIRIPT
ncbi:MAG: oligosaccharide flippase family protein, partial [Methylomicrobium sp.]|nr:oligosaccharide flippase family protein [Methylomicrobium sp.]